MADSDHRRLILRNFLSQQLCKELEFIHKSCCTVGYRPNVFSTTLSHLIATNSAQLVMPLVSIRERLKEKAEEHFGCEYELFIEFTGLISWCKGASIGWHSDDNREYLKQRDFAVVCYLNSYEIDFKGGLFHFQDGEPSTFAPMAGDVLIYTADNKNIHCVSEITEGERTTLTLWLTRDASHDEDAKLVKSLSDCWVVNNPPIASCYPVEASNSMYWYPPEEASVFQSGFDIRCGRLHVFGFDIYSECCCSSSNNLLELLKEPLRLARGDELLPWKFVNIFHALQAVQFYYWMKGSKEKRISRMMRIIFTHFLDIDGACNLTNLVFLLHSLSGKLILPSVQTHVKQIIDRDVTAILILSWMHLSGARLANILSSMMKRKTAQAALSRMFMFKGQINSKESNSINHFNAKILHRKTILIIRALLIAIGVAR
ncbi:hypothetical protein BUALT_Bualt15G0061300 [Buddleja alternifolia]|uniref:procollagen-proline 3-dioxygenase n=1 Tax=Buddleja alternifolia TaxID=168488 RepID=A0AAV6WNL4_9LAMI|nr:hypothetical protein BUALT_Bualt15G0061300 [Buddleja alternifolia]